MQNISETKKIIVDQSLGVELIDNDKYLEIQTEATKLFNVIKVLKEDTKPVSYTHLTLPTILLV